MRNIGTLKVTTPTDGELVMTRVLSWRHSGGEMEMHGVHADAQRMERRARGE